MRVLPVGLARGVPSTFCPRNNCSRYRYLDLTAKCDNKLPFHFKAKGAARLRCPPLYQVGFQGGHPGEAAGRRVHKQGSIPVRLSTFLDLQEGLSSFRCCTFSLASHAVCKSAMRRLPL